MSKKSRDALAEIEVLKQMAIQSSDIYIKKRATRCLHMQLQMEHMRQLLL